MLVQHQNIADLQTIWTSAIPERGLGASIPAALHCYPDAVPLLAPPDMAAQAVAAHRMLAQLLLCKTLGSQCNLLLGKHEPGTIASHLGCRLARLVLSYALRMSGCAFRRREGVDPVLLQLLLLNIVVDAWLKIDEYKRQYLVQQVLGVWGTIHRANSLSQPNNQSRR